MPSTFSLRSASVNSSKIRLFLAVWSHPPKTSAGALVSSKLRSEAVVDPPLSSLASRRCSSSEHLGDGPVDFQLVGVPDLPRVFSKQVLQGRERDGPVTSFQPSLSGLLRRHPIVADGDGRGERVPGSVQLSGGGVLGLRLVPGRLGGRRHDGRGHRQLKTAAKRARWLRVATAKTPANGSLSQNGYGTSSSNVEFTSRRWTVASNCHNLSTRTGCPRYRRPMCSKRRKQKNDSTGEKEKTQLRALLGGLSWHAQQVAPHAAAEVSLLLSEVNHSTVSTIQKASLLRPQDAHLCL